MKPLIPNQFLQILISLDAVDLAHLLLVNQNIRKWLKQPLQKYIWRQVRSRLVEVPQCPEGMSEMRFSVSDKLCGLGWPVKYQPVKGSQSCGYVGTYCASPGSKASKSSRTPSR